MLQFIGSQRVVPNENFLVSGLHRKIKIKWDFFLIFSPLLNHGLENSYL